MESRERIKKSSNFRYVYNKGKSLSDKNLVLYAARNGKPYNKVGLSVSKKIGNSVTRNRVRRLVKEAYRLNKEIFKVGYDLVFVGRFNSANVGFKEIEKSIKNLMTRSDLVKIDMSKKDMIRSDLVKDNIINKASINDHSIKKGEDN